MNNYLKYSIGNDISMDKFDSCLSVIDKEQRVIIKASRSFKNNKNGFNAFQDWVQRHLKYQLPVSFTMEATGVYYEALAIFLHEQGYYVSVVLPNKAKSYLKSLGIKSKNDKIDAKGLSQMGAEQRLDQWQPYSKTIYELRSLTRQSEKLNKQKSIFNNQLHAEEHSGYINKTVVEQLNKMIALISTNILEVKQAQNN